MNTIGVQDPLGKRCMRGVKGMREIGRKIGVIGMELKVEQMITSFDIQGRKGVKFVTLALGDYGLIWWTSMMDDIRRGIIKPCESWYHLKRLM
ncbi:hypothetical protein CR513_20745, partial [Mucuna pruriens]